VWAVLPADCERTVVVGDPVLAASLDDAGLGAEEGSGNRTAPADALLLAGTATPERLGERLRRLQPGGMVAAVVGDERPRGNRVRRTARRLGAPLHTRTRARRWERELRSAGLATARIATGERWRAHRLGRRRLPAAGEVIAGYSGQPRQSVLEAALEAAADDLGEPVRSGAITVRGSGALLVELNAGSRRLLLRLAGGPAARMLATSTTNLRALASAAPPSVTELLVLPVAEGKIGPARYLLEPRVTGAPPRRIRERQWDDCAEFLAALHFIRSPEAGAGGSLPADAEILMPHLDKRGRGTLGAVVGELETRLDGLPAGWGHGDFWPGNVLVSRGRLVAVIDWDAASPATPPLVDLFHLLLMRSPRLRRRSHGRRCTEILWPLLQNGGDWRLRRFCEQASIPHDVATLTALGTAYWLIRVARDLRQFEDRPSRPRWMTENVYRPLADLGT